MANRINSLSTIGTTLAMLTISVMYESTDSLCPCSRVHIDVAFRHLVMSVMEKRWRNSAVRDFKLPLTVDGNDFTHSFACQ
jgi:hypothetical protein